LSSEKIPPAVEKWHIGKAGKSQGLKVWSGASGAERRRQKKKREEAQKKKEQKMRTKKAGTRRVKVTVAKSKGRKTCKRASKRG
jgi:hypothetical protein